MHIDDAISLIIEYVKSDRNGDANFGNAYELYLANIIQRHLNKTGDLLPGYVTDHPRCRELSAVFFEAAWELCRRGILRPSVQFLGGQGTSDGSGYTITAQGRLWIDKQADEILIGGPDRVTELFRKFADKFGSAFLQRAAEAAPCYAFGNHLACCTMCGAAAESVLLAVAIAKNGDEAAILAPYRAANGRRRIIDSVVGQAKPALAEPFRNATGLLSYWRDDAAHGLASTISEIEAHEALGRLLRFTQFSADNWEALTTS